MTIAKSRKTTYRHTQEKNIRKLLTFSKEMYNLALSKAQSLGLTFSEYLKHLIAQDIQDQTALLSSEGLTNKDIKNIQRSQDQLNRLDRVMYKTIRTKEQISNLIDNSTPVNKEINKNKIIKNNYDEQEPDQIDF